MGDSTKIELVGFDELARALDNADGLFMPVASKAIAISLSAIESEIAPYPPQPDRMRSGHLNTYVRGVGRYPKSAFIPDSAEPGGYSLKKGSKAVKLTSQQMNKKFRQKVELSKKAIIGELRNDATYSGWVIGSKDENDDPHQVSFHAETGWVNSDDAVEKATPVIMDSMNLALEEFIKKLAGV